MPTEKIILGEKLLFLFVTDFKSRKLIAAKTRFKNFKNGFFHSYLEFKYALLIKKKLPENYFSDSLTLQKYLLTQI
jgi:hypothetical protein